MIKAKAERVAAARVTEELHRALRQESADLDCSQQDIVIEALTARLAHRLTGKRSNLDPRKTISSNPRA